MIAAETDPICRNAQPSHIGLADRTVSLLFVRKYSVPQACKLIGVGQTKMREMINAGKIPILDLDGKQMLLETDLQAYLESRLGTIEKQKIERSKGKLSSLPQHVEESEFVKRLKRK